MNIKIAALVLLMFLTFSLAQAKSVETVQAKRADGKSAKIAAAFLGQDEQAYNLILPEIQIDLTSTIPGLHKSGTVYQLPSPLTASELSWQSVNGGFVARIHLVSPQAKRLRIHLVFSQTISPMIFRLQGNKDASPLKPINQSLINKNDIWLPITKGNAADLEIFVADTNPPDGLFSIDAINVIVADLKNGRTTKTIIENLQNNHSSLIKAQSLGLAQDPEYDLVCWEGIKQYPALQQAASATVLVEFIKNWSSYICSGTLLTDTKHSMTPWFVTANHCIGNQAAANTATFQWFDQATSCLGSTTDSRDTQTSGGAKILWKNVQNDTTFMKLRVLPPAGVSYMGWDSNKLTVGNSAWGVHHPQGDQTMVSLGNVIALDTNIKGDDGSTRLLNTVEYKYGGTEDGSSGSGLFTMSKGKAKWRGALYGGSANDYQNGVYSDFNNYYLNIEYWLTGQSLSRQK